MAPARPRPPALQGTLKAYWFSQTIGLDRGLQSFIQALARTRARVTLDIRGATGGATASGWSSWRAGSASATGSICCRSRRPRRW